MKYKLYYIKDKKHQYYKEIRGIRYYHQYHLLPDNAEFVNKEYDSRIDSEPELFLKDKHGFFSNITKYKVRDDFNDIVAFTPTELQNHPEKIKQDKKEKLERELKKIKKQKKKDELESLKASNPDLVDLIEEEKTKIDRE